jgi:hypothetical protein
MRLINLLIISFLTTASAFGVNKPSFLICNLIVNTEIKHAASGKNDGEIIFTIENYDAGRHKIFLLNKGNEVAKNELKGMKAAGLKQGSYEFIIIDTKGDKCFKELTVVIKEN